MSSVFSVPNVLQLNLVTSFIYSVKRKPVSIFEQIESIGHFTVGYKELRTKGIIKLSKFTCCIFLEVGNSETFLVIDFFFSISRIFSYSTKLFPQFFSYSFSFFQGILCILLLNQVRQYFYYGSTAT